jgi:transcriptional regulator with XRE-family HTH domain
MATEKSNVHSAQVSAPINRASVCVLLGNKIRKLRNERGWSQQILADHAGMERAHLGRLEEGRKEAGVITLQKIADALEVQVWELLKA